MKRKDAAKRNEGGGETNRVLEKSANQRLEAEEALRRSEERYHNVYHTAPLAFVIWDRECRITDWNRRAEQMFGWTREEVLGRNFFHFLIPERARPQVSEVVDGLLRGDLPSQSVNENLIKNGEIILCEWNNSILYDSEGRIEGALSLALDITERKESEETILRSSEKFKQFAYSVMHDLKSPAIGIHGLAELLHKQYRDALHEKGRKYCEQILKASVHLAALVEMINGYIAARESDLRLDKIDVKEVLQTVREQFSPRLIARQIEWVEPEVLPKITADRLSIYRILSNLVDNALKYGGEDLTEIRIGYC